MASSQSYKVLLIGESGTGKKTIIRRNVQPEGSIGVAPIGVDYGMMTIQWNEETTVHLQLWNIAGQDRTGNMCRAYYRDAVGAFVVFDVTKETTLDSALRWKADLDSKVFLGDGSYIPAVLLANKYDQAPSNMMEKLDKACKEGKFVAWFKTSTKEYIGLEEAAKCLITKIKENEKHLLPLGHPPPLGYSPPSLGLTDKATGKTITIDRSHLPSQEDKSTCC